jgi:hypothetical protein
VQRFAQKSGALPQLARQGRIDGKMQRAPGVSFGMSNGRGFDADVILSGGGLVGQTLALALDQAAFPLLVIDASKPSDTLAPAFDGRAFAIAFASYRMWRALGLGDQLDQVAQPIEQIMVTDGKLGRAAQGRGLAAASAF